MNNIRYSDDKLDHLTLLRLQLSDFLRRWRNGVYWSWNMSNVVIAWEIQSLCSKFFILRPPFRSCPNNLLAIKVHLSGLIQILSPVAFCSQSLLWTPQNNKRIHPCLWGHVEVTVNVPFMVPFIQPHLLSVSNSSSFTRKGKWQNNEILTPLLLTVLRINIRAVHVSSSGVFHHLSANWFIVMGFCCIYLCYYLLLLLF